MMCFFCSVKPGLSKRKTPDFFAVVVSVGKKGAQSFPIGLYFVPVTTSSENCSLCGNDCRYQNKMYRLKRTVISFLIIVQPLPSPSFYTFTTGKKVKKNRTYTNYTKTYSQSTTIGQVCRDAPQQQNTRFGRASAEVALPRSTMGHTARPLYTIFVFLLLSVSATALNDEDRAAASLEALDLAPKDEEIGAIVLYCTHDQHCRYFKDRFATCNLDTHECICGSTDFVAPLCNPAHYNKVRVSAATYYSKGACEKATEDTDVFTALKAPYNALIKEENEDVMDEYKHFCGSVLTLAQMKLNPTELIDKMNSVADAIPQLAETSKEATGYEYGGGILEIYVKPLASQEDLEVETAQCHAFSKDSYVAQNDVCYIMSCYGGYSRTVEMVDGIEKHDCIQDAAEAQQRGAGYSAVDPSSGYRELTDSEKAAMVIGLLVLITLTIYLFYTFTYGDTKRQKRLDKKWSERAAAPLPFDPEEGPLPDLEGADEYKSAPYGAGDLAGTMGGTMGATLAANRVNTPTYSDPFSTTGSPFAEDAVAGNPATQPSISSAPYGDDSSPSMGGAGGSAGRIYM